MHSLDNMKYYFAVDRVLFTMMAIRGHLCLYVLTMSFCEICDPREFFPHLFIELSTLQLMKLYHNPYMDFYRSFSPLENLIQSKASSLYIYNYFWIYSSVYVVYNFWAVSELFLYSSF